MTLKFILMNRIFPAFCVLAAGIVIISSAHALEEKVIAVILSRSISPYREALEGFKEDLASRGVKVKYAEYDLSSQGSGQDELARAVTESGAVMAFTVGTEASLFARSRLKETPAVFSMVLNPVESGIVSSLEDHPESVTGVSLNISIEEQFSLMRKLKPGITRVGMVYSARDRMWLKDMALKAAKSEGIQLVAMPVESQAEILDSVERVCRHADFLWAGSDPLIYNANSAQHILLVTLREKIPFMAFSSHYVEAGALLALECDYTDIGRQAGRIALKVMEGYPAKDMRVEPPRKTVLSLNLRTARIIGLDIPLEIVEKADKVYGNL